MDVNEEPGLMVKYQFEIDDEDWEDWKRTVPRMKSLDDRIRELIRADTEGRVRPPTDTGEGGPAESPEVQTTQDTGPKKSREPAPEIREQLREALPASGDTLEARVDTVLQMYDLLRRREEEIVKTQELKDLVDADEVGFDSVDSFWSNALKKNKSQNRPNALKILPGVEELGNGRYKYTGGDNE